MLLQTNYKSSSRNHKEIDYNRVVYTQRGQYEPITMHMAWQMTSFFVCVTGCHGDEVTHPWFTLDVVALPVGNGSQM